MRLLLLPHSQQGRSSLPQQQEVLQHVLNACYASACCSEALASYACAGRPLASCRLRVDRSTSASSGGGGSEGGGGADHLRLSCRCECSQLETPAARV